MEFKNTVLVIEDHAPINFMCCRVIERWGYETLSAFDGRAGLDLLHSKKIDVIIMDFYMPKISGLDILRIMRKDPNLSRIPVIVMTADPSSETREMFEGLDCYAYLNKPIIFNRLQEKIAEALAIRK